MPTKVIMPQMGESIFEGTITKWLKKIGEKVNRDEPLFEISTDKVDSEIPAPAGGILSEILVPEGKTVQINTVVAVIEGEVAAVTPAETMDEASNLASAPAVPTVPGPGTPPPAAPPQSIPEDRESVPPVAPVATREPRPSATTVQPSDIRTSPLVRRLARETGIELADVRGTGLGGRITREDIESHLQQRSQQAEIPPGGEVPARVLPPPEIPRTAASPDPGAAPPVIASAPSPEPRYYGDAESVQMTPMRKAIAEHMVLSKRTSAHVNTVFEVDVSSIVILRERHKTEFEKREGIKLTFTPFFVKALVDAVREFPVLNCSVSGESIIYKKSINVGVAVALESGLIVPVVREAHLKSFTGLSLAINDLAQRARSKRLRPEDVQNGTISVTNPGIYGSLFGTPIISQPQVAILGVGGIEKRPVVINDAIAIRSMAYLSLSFDHRVIDGAVADQFMASLKARLQSWTNWID